MNFTQLSAAAPRRKFTEKAEANGPLAFATTTEAPLCSICQCRFIFVKISQHHFTPSAGFQKQLPALVLSLTIVANIRSELQQLCRVHVRDAVHRVSAAVSQSPAVAASCSDFPAGWLQADARFPQRSYKMSLACSEAPWQRWLTSRR